MKQLRYRVLLSCAAFLGIIASCTYLPPTQTQFTVDIQGDGNQITYEIAGGVVTFKVTSPTGMGSATVKLTAGALPGRVVLRLNLQGLEDLDFTYGAVTVTASVPTSAQDLVLESVKSADGSAETEIEPGSPYWMEIRQISTGEGPDSEVSGQSYFEVEAPQDFLTGPHQDFFIHWLDFYR
jgi:hypothetical protein